VMSYDGHLGFGLLGDYDALPDLEKLALDLKWAVGELVRAAGVRPPAGRASPARPTRKPAASRENGARPAAKRSSGTRGSATKPASAS